MTEKVKKKNHEVTKALLKRWRSTEDKLWVLDIESQKIEPRSLEATFAIDHYLYVPKIGDKRDDATEEWFSGAENELAAFLQRLETKDYTKPIEQKKIFLTLLALVGLSHRSRYELERVVSELESNQSLRTQLGTDLSTPELRHRFSVENMIYTIDQQVRRFCQGSVTITFGTKRKLLICDRPGAEMGFVQGGVNFVPLGANEYVYMDASDAGLVLTRGAVFRQSDHGTEQIIDSINEQTIKRARKWMVAQSREELEKIATELTKEKVAARESKDRLSFTPLTEEQRQNAWRLKNPEE
jgi:hypothetical protein